jgi:hypothetical protein
MVRRVRCGGCPERALRSSTLDATNDYEIMAETFDPVGSALGDRRLRRGRCRGRGANAFGSTPLRNAVCGHAAAVPDSERTSMSDATPGRPPIRRQRATGPRRPFPSRSCAKTSTSTPRIAATQGSATSASKTTRNREGCFSVPYAWTVMESMSSLRYWSGTITRLRRAAEHGHLRAFETPRPRHEHDPPRVSCTSPSWPDGADTVRLTTDSIDKGVLLDDTASATAPIDAASLPTNATGRAKVPAAAWEI